VKSGDSGSFNAAKEAKSAHRKWKDKKNLHLNADLEKQELKKEKEKKRHL
jgi:hypothetical protein